MDQRSEVRGPRSERERIVLHLDMNAFFASVEQRDHPQLRGRPVFICGNLHSRTVVATASYEARAFGVTTGMPLHEARALCPSAILVEGHPGRYAEIFGRVAQMMERYSPLVEIFSIDEAFMDLTPTAARFGGSLAVARALWQDVQDAVSLPCSIGLGPNKLIAKLASSRKKPNGIVEIRAEELATVLEPLRVEELCGIGPAFQAALNAHGIRTCGELALVPVARLMRQFGAHAGLHLARLARGADAAPVVPSDEAPSAKSMGHLHTLSRDTADVALIKAVLLGLAEKTGRRLRADGAAGCTVTLTLRYRDFTTLTRSRTLDRFLDEGRDIYDAGCRILEGIALAQAIRLVGISVSGLSRGSRQAWWLPEVARQARLTAARDRLADRFGDDVLAPAAVWLVSDAERHYQTRR